MAQTVTVDGLAIPTKPISLKFAGAKRPAEEVFISPQATAATMLRELGMSEADYMISLGSPNNVIRPNQDLFPLVNAGDTLYVSPHATAGRA
jgi:hypothetical protein